MQILRQQKMRAQCNNMYQENSSASCLQGMLRKATPAPPQAEKTCAAAALQKMLRCRRKYCILQ